MLAKLRSIFERRRDIGLTYAVFLVLFYLLFFRSNFNAVTLELYLNTNHSSVLELFIPNADKKYQQSNSRQIRFPEGDSGHRLGYKALSRNAPLRLDPSTQIGNVTLKKIIIHHMGFKNVIEKDSFDEALLECINANCRVSESGLSIEASSNDSRILLANKIVPGNTVGSLVLFLVLTGLVSLAIIALHAHYFGHRRASIRIFAFFCLIMMLLSYWNQSIDSLYPALIYSVMAAILLTNLSPYLYRLVSGNPKNAVDASVLLTGIVFFIVWSAFSFTSQIHQDIVDELSGTKAKNSTAQSMLVAYKERLDAVYGKFLYGSKQLINWDAKFKIFGLGFTPNSKTILGKDQWYFEGYGSRKVEKGIVRNIDNITDYMGQNPLSEAELRRWKDVLEERYYWLKENNIDYIFALAPTKALVYPEKLPDRIYKRQIDLDQPSRYTQLIEYLTKNSVVPVVDLQAAMVAAKNNHQWPLFYRTDFHWNYLGAFYAYQAIADTINTHYPKYNFTPMDMNDFRVDARYDWAHLGFLTLAGLNPGEHKDDTYLRLYPENAQHYAADSEYYTRGIWDGTIPKLKSNLIKNDTTLRVRELYNDSANLDRLFVIGDSFSEKMTAYFSAHARFVNNYRTVTQFETAPIKQLKPQIVIQEILNMYILSEPPSNTKEVASVRERMPREVKSAL